MGDERSTRFSVRYGSFFVNTQLSIHQILRAAYYWANHPSSTIATVLTETNIHSKHTIIDYYNFFATFVKNGPYGHKSTIDWVVSGGLLKLMSQNYSTPSTTEETCWEEHMIGFLEC